MGWGTERPEEEFGLALFILENPFSKAVLLSLGGEGVPLQGGSCWEKGFHSAALPAKHQVEKQPVLSGVFTLEKGTRNWELLPTNENAVALFTPWGMGSNAQAHQWWIYVPCSEAVF